MLKLSKIFIKNLKSSTYLIYKLILRDLYRLNYQIFSNEHHIKKAINWLVYAQKINKDGGISEGYDLIYGWLPSYPETSGYIIPTLFDYYFISKNAHYIQICKEIADWECSIQLKSGGFRNNKAGFESKAFIFDTGQILLGLIRAYKELKDLKYLKSCINAGNFLIETQNEDGNWIKNNYLNRSLTYNIRTAWALLELFLITNDQKYKNGAIKNIEWTLKQVTENYWFKNLELEYYGDPLLHFIAYTIEGLLECGIILKDNRLIQVSFNSSLQLLNYFENYGKLPATFNSKWYSHVNYSCLTGIAQLSIIWLKLSQIFNNEKFFLNAIKANNYLKQKQILNNRFKDIDGAIKGSDPIWGKYSRFKFPNWAVKFFCDALMLENRIKEEKLFPNKRKS
jgi:hypothetical protein